MSRRDFKMVVVGAGGVGKSCLTARFVQDIWIESYDPTIEDTYRKHISIDGRQHMLEILDTAGTEQFTAMSEMYMQSGQGFLLVFSLTSMASLHELSDLRQQILGLQDDKDVPIVVVGNKSDLLEDRKVSYETARTHIQGWGHAPYYETSARQRVNVDEVFMDLCHQIIAKEGIYPPDFEEEEDEPEYVYHKSSPATHATHAEASISSGRHRSSRRGRKHRSQDKGKDKKNKKKHSDCVIL